MNKEEFVKELSEYKGGKELADKIYFEQIGDALWEKVQTVYNFHPAIDNVEGKKQIARLVATAGYGILDAMLPVAIEARAIDEEEMEIRAEREKLNLRERELNDKLAGLASGWRIIRSE